MILIGDRCVCYFIIFADNKHNSIVHKVYFDVILSTSIEPLVYEVFNNCCELISKQNYLF